MAVPPFIPGTVSFNGAKASPEVASAIRQASAKTGVDFKYLVAQAGQESSFKADAKASTSSASGLYQFIDSTWMNMIRDKGADYGLGNFAQQIDGNGGVASASTRQQILALRNDPTVSAQMAAEYAKSNRSQLERDLGRATSSTDLYMAHFLGAAGASKFLNTLDTAPNKSGAEVLPAAASANRGAFFDKQGKPLSVAQIYNHYAQRFDGAVRDAAATPLDNVAPNQPQTVNQMAAVKTAIFQALAGQQLSPVTIDALMKLKVPDLFTRQRA